MPGSCTGREPMTAAAAFALQTPYGAGRKVTSSSLVAEILQKHLSHSTLMNNSSQSPPDPEPFPVSPPPYVPMTPEEIPEEMPGQPHNPDPDYPGPAEPAPQ